MKHLVSTTKLKNGSFLVNITIPNIEVSVFSVWFKAGVRYSPKRKDGLAHFVEHLIMKKTDELSLQKEIEKNGIILDKYTNYETIRISQTQHENQLEKSIELFFDNLNNQKITNLDIEQEKQNIKNERDEKESDYFGRIWENAVIQLFPNSDIGRVFFGNDENILGFTKKDVEDYLENRLNINNATFVFVGNKKTDELKKMIEDNLKKDDKKVVSDSESINLKEASPLLSIEKFKGKHSTISIAFKGESTLYDIKKRAVVALVIKILSNGWSSKLIQNLRIENNLTYWVNGYYDEFSDVDVLQFVFSVDNSGVEKSVNLTLNEMLKMKEGKFVQEDLEIAKKTLKLAYGTGFMDLNKIVGWYGWQSTVSENLINDRIEDFLNEIETVTKEDIVAFSKKIFKKENLAVSVIGDIKEFEIDFK